jgi:hypothetical protein
MTPTPQEKLKALLISRKFWAAIAAIIFAIFGTRAGMDQTTLLSAIGTLIAYILGTGLEGISKS